MSPRSDASQCSWMRARMSASRSTAARRARQDLNLRPLAPEASALSTELLARASLILGARPGSGRRGRARRLRIPAEMRIPAAVLEEFGAPLAGQELDLAEPGAGEVLGRLEACGLCHTDMYTASGADPSGYAPTVLGHEGAGVVEKTG